MKNTNYEKRLLLSVVLIIVMMYGIFLTLLHVNKSNQPVFINTEPFYVVSYTNPVYTPETDFQILKVRGLKEHEGLYDDISTNGEDPIKRTNKTYNFKDPSKRGEIIDDIMSACIHYTGPKLCDLVYADLLLRTQAIENTIEDLYSALSEKLQLYVNNAYQDERELADFIFDYVEVLDKLASTGHKNEYCPTVAKTTFTMMANEKGIDIYEPIQLELLGIWAARACGDGYKHDLNLDSHNIDPGNITAEDMVRCSLLDNCDEY